MKTLTRDRQTLRPRDIQPGEQVKSLYDDIHGTGTRFVAFDENMQEFKPPPHLFYNENDEAEDLILFPEEANDQRRVPLFGTDSMNAVQRFETLGPKLDRLFFDLDTDDESIESESCEKRRSDESRGTDDELDLGHDEDLPARSDKEDEESFNCKRAEEFSPEFQEFFHLFKEWKLSKPENFGDSKARWNTYVDREKSKGATSYLRGA